jgi:ribokinase
MPPAFGPVAPALVILGEFFRDLVFYNLPKPPEIGREVKAKGFSEWPGGGVATTALVAAKLGTPTSIFTRVGTDAGKTLAWRSLVGRGISMGACEVAAAAPTALTVAINYNGDRMLVTHDAVSAGLEKLLSRQPARKILKNAKHLHLACALRPPSAWVAVVRKLRAQGISISADIGWNPDVFRSRHLPVLLQELDFIFPNEREARAITGEASARRAAEKMARWVRHPIVKIGAGGCIAVRDGRILTVPSLRVHAIDATGAGDAFNGAFLHGYLSGWPLEDCLRAGNVCGALATTGPGGSSAIPTRGKLKALMKRIA